jgi:hypothetical protein
MTASLFKLDLNSLTTENVALITSKLDEVRSLMSFSVGLSADERRRYPALGSKGTQYVQRSVESMKQNPSLVPAFVSAAEVENMYDAYNKLLVIVESIAQLQRLAKDTMHIAGSNARSQSNEFYNSVKRGSKANVPGAQAVADSLKNRFKVNRRNGRLTEADGPGSTAVV